MGMLTMTIVYFGIKNTTQINPKSFVSVCDFKKNQVLKDSQSASGSKGVSYLFTEFIEPTYVNDSWVSPPDLVNEEPLFESLQFTDL
jgi:hypothetical protein